MEAKVKEWVGTLAPFSRTPVVTYHATWRYFAERFGLRSELFLEPKPGIPPSPPHLAEVIGTMNDQKIKLILIEPYQPRKVGETVVSHTAAELVSVAQFPGALQKVIQGSDHGLSDFPDYLDEMLAFCGIGVPLGMKAGA